MPSAKEHNSQKAFTLVELLIYIGIFSVVAGLVLGILNSTIRSNQAEVANNEVTTQLNTVLTDIQNQVNQSSNLEVYPSVTNLALPTSTGSFLKLRMSSSSTDPTCIYLASSTVYMAQGPDPTNASQCNQANATALTTSRVLANNLTFTQITIPGGHASVSISLQITYNSSNPAFAISKTLQSAIGRVSAATFDDNLLPNADNTFDIGQIAPNLRWRNGNFAGTVTIGTAGGSLGIGTETPSGVLDVVASSTNALVVTSNGTVGIGTVDPSLGGLVQSAFTIQPTSGTGTGLAISDTSGTPAFALNPQSNGSWVMYDHEASSSTVWTPGITQSGGYVGIGTTNPSTSLDVVDSTAADQTPIAVFGDGGNSSRYAFLADRGGGAVFEFTSSGIDSIRSAGDLRVEVSNSTTPSLYITSTGLVGIGGEWSPTAALEVQGTTSESNGPIAVFANSSGAPRVSILDENGSTSQPGGIYSFYRVWIRVIC